MADQPPATASDAALAVAEPTDLGYAVSLEAFSGPLDLLLYLVRKTELDIADIPVSVIADQFVATVRGWQERDELDLEIAGDFILMAATLIEIKARALAPPPEEETNDDGSADDDEFADPRADLIRKLLAYRKYKEAAQLLVGRETARAERVYRRFKEEIPEDPEEAEAIDLGELDPGGLAKHWFTIVARLGGLGPRTVSRDDIPIESRITSVLARAEEVRNVTLTELFERETSLQGRVTTLMAILEVVRQRYLESRQLEQYGGVDLRWREAEERTRAAELPPAEIEIAEPKRRRRRPPLLTWVPRADIPSESTADAETETETTPEPFESDEERFLRELNETCNLDQVLVRAKDWESEFAAHWNELHPPPAPEPVPVVEPPPVAVAEAAPAPEPVTEPVAEVIIAPEVAIVAPEAGADGATPPPKPTKPKWVPPWVLAKQNKERAALEQAEQAAREQATLEQAALEQAALEQAALEQAAHAPVVAELTPDAERTAETSVVLDTPQISDAAPSSEIVADQLPLELLAQVEVPGDEILTTAESPLSADLPPASTSPDALAEPVPEPAVALVPDKPAVIETVTIEPDAPTSAEPVTGGDEPPVNEIPPVVCTATVTVTVDADAEPADAPEAVVAARDLGLAQPEAITELEEAATEPATIDLLESEPEPVADLDGDEAPTPTPAAPVTMLATDDTLARSAPELDPIKPITPEASPTACAMPADEPPAAPPTAAAEALPTVVDAPTNDAVHDRAADPFPEVAAEVVACAQAIAAEPVSVPVPDPVSAPAVVAETQNVEPVPAAAQAPPATTATTTSPWPLVLALGLSSLLIGGLFLSKHLVRPTAVISRSAPVSPTPVLLAPELIAIVEPLPIAVPLPTLWELWTAVEPTRWIALIRPAVVPWTAWLPTAPPWPALDDLRAPIDLTTLPVAALGVPGGGIFARCAALPQCQVVPWDAYLLRPPQAPALIEWIAASSRTEVPLAAWAQPNAWTLMIAPQPLR